MITKFSRKFWEAAVEAGGSEKIILRNYDILMLRKKGKSLAQIGIKNHISKVAVAKVIKKYGKPKGLPGIK